MFEEAVDEAVDDVDNRRNEDGNDQLVRVIADRYLYEFLPGQLIAGDLQNTRQSKADEKDDESIHKLAERRAARRPQPEHPMTGSAFERLENHHIEKLCNQKCHQRSDDDPHGLPEYAGEHLV